MAVFSTHLRVLAAVLVPAHLTIGAASTGGGAAG